MVTRLKNLTPHSSSIPSQRRDAKVKEDWAVTTEMVRKELKISWNTAQLHLYKPKSEGLVKGKRVGRQNQWILTDSGKETAA